VQCHRSRSIKGHARAVVPILQFDPSLVFPSGRLRLAPTGVIEEEFCGLLHIDRQLQIEHAFGNEKRAGKGALAENFNGIETILRGRTLIGYKRAGLGERACLF
jgi:hypothetical protein